MNRELKFRVWNNKLNTFDNPSQLEVFNNSGELCHILDIDRRYTVIQQCTGMKDKNNREVYEGDIVKIVGGKNVE